MNSSGDKNYEQALTEFRLAHGNYGGVMGELFDIAYGLRRELIKARAKLEASPSATRPSTSPIGGPEQSAAPSHERPAQPYATCRNGGECLDTERCDDHPQKCVRSSTVPSEPLRKLITAVREHVVTRSNDEDKIWQAIAEAESSLSAIGTREAIYKAGYYEGYNDAAADGVGCGGEHDVSRADEKAAAYLRTTDGRDKP